MKKMNNQNKQNENQVKDFSLLRKNMYSSEIDCFAKADNILQDRLDLEDETEKQKGNQYAGLNKELNATLTARWYKAWRDCEFTDEFIEKLEKANSLLLDSICEMSETVYKLAQWERRRLNKRGKGYTCFISADLRVSKLRNYKGNYNSIYFSHYPYDVSREFIKLSFDEPIGKKWKTESLNNMIEIPETEICEAARIYDNFLRKLGKSKKDFFCTSNEGGVTAKEFLHLSGNVGRKWEKFFTRVEKLKDHPISSVLLAMIGRFKLTPEDIFNIADYDFDIKFEHHPWN